MKKIQFKDASLGEVIGTSSHRGYVRASAKELSKVLGSPLTGDGDKTTFEWNKKFGSIIFTVYDYKEGYITSQTEVEYHIGTKSSEDTGLIVGLLIGLGLDAYINR